MKHVWYRPGAAHRGRARKCLRCGIRRRIKPGTKLTWEYRFQAGDAWRERVPCRGPR